MWSLILSTAWAQESARPAPSFLEQMMPFVFILIIFYFLIIRPQQRRARDQQNFLGQLKRGDEVLTAGGVLGTIEGLTEKFVTLEVAEGVRVRVLRSSISSSHKEDKK